MTVGLHLRLPKISSRSGRRGGNRFVYVHCVDITFQLDNPPTISKMNNGRHTVMCRMTKDYDDPSVPLCPMTAVIGLQP